MSKCWKPTLVIACLALHLQESALFSHQAIKKYLQLVFSHLKCLVRPSRLQPAWPDTARCPRLALDLIRLQDRLLWLLHLSVIDWLLLLSAWAWATPTPLLGC